MFRWVNAFTDEHKEVKRLQTKRRWISTTFACSVNITFM